MALFYFIALFLLAGLFGVLAAVHLLGLVLGVAAGAVVAFLVVVWVGIEIRKKRQRRAGWPALTRWALERDWSVGRRELDWVTRHDWLPNADAGPYLVVSGRLQGLPFEVADIPWTEPVTDTTDEDGPDRGVYHVVAAHLPRDSPRGSVDGDTLARLRARNIVSWDIADDLVVARIQVLDFEAIPDVIQPAVELVLRVLEQRFAVDR